MGKCPLSHHSNHRAPALAPIRWLGSFTALMLVASFAIAAVVSTGPPKALGAPGRVDGTSTTEAVTLNFIQGWNLVGNSSSGTLDVAVAFNDGTKVATVWKWVAEKSRWAFYAPNLPGGGADYASSKGYEPLTTIAGGEGFWVNASSAFTAQLAAGSAIGSASFQGIAPGWNLIAVGDNPTPSEFNRALSLTEPVAGDIPLNVTSLWAWNAGNRNWYFYAPGLEKNGGLASYIDSKSYLDFGTNTLGPTTGFWVNVPADTSATTTTTTTTTTSTTAATTSTTTTTASTTPSTTIISAPPCTYGISPTSGNYGAQGANGSFSVQMTNSPCLIQAWTVAASPWITSVSTYAPSNGNGSVEFWVLANDTAAARAGVITITQPAAPAVNYNVTQDGANPFQGTVYGTWAGTCSYDIGLTSIDPTFTMTIDANGGVSGTYTGYGGGTITGSVSAVGALTTVGASTVGGGGSGGISWSGNFALAGGILTANGQWNDGGYCSGTWSAP